ncbi:MAG: RNA polymerase sigma-70 factor [Cyclobacteriaceae bacterium]
MAKIDDVRQWVRNITEHDCKTSFRLIFDTNYAKLYRMALYWIKSEELAEEVVSDVFVKLWKNRKQLSEIHSLDDYLFIAVKRQSLNYLSKIQKYQGHENTDHLINLTATSDTQPDQRYLQQELQEIVGKAIEQLPARCRLIFQLVRIDGMKYQQVADQLEISPKTVENQLLKATLIVRESIRGYAQHTDMQQYVYHLSRLITLPILVCFC